MTMFSLHVDEEDQLNKQEPNDLNQMLNAHKRELLELREENKLISDLLFRLLSSIETDFKECYNSDDYTRALFGLSNLAEDWFLAKKENKLKLLQQSALAKLTPEELVALKQLGLP